MSDEIVPIEKHDIPASLLDVVESFSTEAQAAALRKAKELGLDLKKGTIPFDETLINLSNNRDVLSDAVKAGKIPQLPLKVQISLLSDARKASLHLTALGNGTDAILPLENAVEDLTATVWQSNLQLLSGEVLGLQTKLNQLKTLESSLRSLTRKAEDFGVVEDRAEKSVVRIEELAQASELAGKRAIEGGEAVEKLLSATKDIEQRATAAWTSIQQQEKTITDSAANTKLMAADVVAASNRSKQLLADLETLKTEYSKLQDQIGAFRIETETALKTAAASQAASYSALDAKSKSDFTVLQVKLDEKFQALSVATTTATTATATLIQKDAAELLASVKAAEQLRQQTAQAQLKSNADSFAAAATDIENSYKEQSEATTLRADAIIDKNKEETMRLTNELDRLEGLIREKIQLATNYQLFHSFQTRQLAIAKGKTFWVWALAACVLVSICLSAWLITYLPYVKVFNVAFYLKLSISLPIIFAITFCSVQYSHERRLEEEYAFKSNISISLDPYRKLVADLIDSTNLEEKAKYTTFIISSIEKVFTSPLASAADPIESTNAVEQILKALGGVVEPFAKLIKR